MTLRQLLHHTSGRMAIPAYQRRYIWGESDNKAVSPARKLLQDIIDASAKGDDVFLQGLVLVRRDDATEVVDGQQRLTFLYLLLRHLGMAAEQMTLTYDCRPKAAEWLERAMDGDMSVPGRLNCQDVANLADTMHLLRELLPEGQKVVTLDYVMDHVQFMCLDLPSRDFTVGSFKLANGTKVPMHAVDVIKGDLMRMASDPAQPQADERVLSGMRARYAYEWEEWVRWWNAPMARDYFKEFSEVPLDLILRLCLRGVNQDLQAPLTYAEFQAAIEARGEEPWHAAKHFMYEVRRAQHHVMQMLDDAELYNRMKAILLLQSPTEGHKFLHACLVRMSITRAEMERIYKLSFLGMDFTEIEQGASPLAKFEDMLASLSMADVYHNEAKRDLFNLLLRLNIDEDIKLGRRFDFSIWNNRSLEHIYSKSKVWHRGRNGEVLDGNDNPLRVPLSHLREDKAYLCREDIVNHDGVQLSEHCIGNLVLLYGQNNATFGNAGFEEKKMMFLTPGDLGVFKSRNLLHSVCVFAGQKWTAQSIIDNYNLTLKNLKNYYGYK